MIPKRNIVAIYGEYSLKRIFLLQGRFYLQCNTLKWMYQIVVLSKHQQVWSPNESPLKFARKHYYFHLSREGIQSSCSRSVQNVAVIIDLPDSRLVVSALAHAPPCPRCLLRMPGAHSCALATASSPRNQALHYCFFPTSGLQRQVDARGQLLRNSLIGKNISVGCSPAYRDIMNARGHRPLRAPALFARWCPKARRHWTWPQYFSVRVAGLFYCMIQFSHMFTSFSSRYWWEQ